MAKQRFTGALNTADFPLVSILQKRTVVKTGADLNVRTPRNPNSTEDFTDQAIPQVLYLENVMPTGEGFQSVGYEKVIDGLPGATVFDQAITLRDFNENNFLFAPAGGLNYIFNANTGVWTSVNPQAAIDKPVTRAYVNGRTFICYEGLGIFEYDAVAGTFTLKTVLGFVNADIRGIGGSSNYLLIFTTLAVHWSSLIDPLDFIPSLTTGAGFSIPQDVKARITAVLGIAGGFIVYTAKNAIAGVYTNNSRAPFTFKEITNAGGILSYEQVTSEQSSGPHYAWTTGGLQKITIQGSEPVSAEVNDFIAGKLWEYYDPQIKLLQQVESFKSEFAVKLAYISSRWLILSYNTSDADGIFNYALVYDTTLKRWGKLKINHVDCFYYPYPNVFGDLSYGNLVNTSYDQLGNASYGGLAVGLASDPPSKLCMGFMTSAGEVKLLEMDYNKTEQQEGVIIFGKFQLTRNKLITMQTVDLEGVYQDTSTGNPQFFAYALASFDGFKPDGNYPMRLLKQGNKLSRYAKRVTAVNVSLLFVGTFAFSSYLLEATEDGDR